MSSNISTPLHTPPPHQQHQQNHPIFSTAMGIFDKTNEQASALPSAYLQVPFLFHQNNQQQQNSLNLNQFSNNSMHYSSSSSASPALSSSPCSSSSQISLPNLRMMPLNFGTVLNNNNLNFDSMNSKSSKINLNQGNFSKFGQFLGVNDATKNSLPKKTKSDSNLNKTDIAFSPQNFENQANPTPNLVYFYYLQYLQNLNNNMNMFASAAGCASSGASSTNDKLNNSNHLSQILEIFQQRTLINNQQQQQFRPHLFNNFYQNFLLKPFAQNDKSQENNTAPKNPNISPIVIHFFSLYYNKTVNNLNFIRLLYFKLL
jgi:hypothetical protein